MSVENEEGAKPEERVERELGDRRKRKPGKKHTASVFVMERQGTAITGAHTALWNPDINRSGSLSLSFFAVLYPHKQRQHPYAMAIAVAALAATASAAAAVAALDT